MESGEMSTSPFPCSARALTLMLAGRSAPQSDRSPCTRRCAVANKPGVPALLRCCRTAAGARRLVPSCYERSRAACKRVLASLGKQMHNVGFLLTLAQCVQGMADPQEVGHLGGTEEMFHSCMETCKRLSSLCSATNATCAIKTQNVTGSILEKW